MKVQEVIHHFDGKKVKLAKALGLSRQYVSNWGDDDMPMLYEMKLKYEILPQLLKGKKRKQAA